MADTVQKRRGGGPPLDGKDPPPDRKRENCCRKLVLPYSVYTFGKEAEIPEYSVKTYAKSQFFKEIFIKKFNSFLDNFQKSVFVQARKILDASFLTFPVWWKLFVKYWLSWSFPQITVDFQEFSSKGWKLWLKIIKWLRSRRTNIRPRSKPFFIFCKISQSR